MKADSPIRSTWLLVAVYAIAMAWVEAAVVFYLRRLTGDSLDPYQANFFPPQAGIGGTEVIREAATLLMLGAVGGLAGRTWRPRLAYTLVAFGLWDIFYYLSLKVITGWPDSLLDWDILFLIPLPWWGPVITPMSIALLMIGWGTLVVWSDPPQPRRDSGWKVWALCGAGILLALYVFMSDAIQGLREGQALEALRERLPVSFPWLPFLFAWLLMSAPVVDQIRARRPPALPASDKMSTSP